MTKLLALALLLAPLAACTDADSSATETSAPAPTDGALTLGEPVVGDAVTPTMLIADASMYADQPVVVEGVAREVCQQAGCWLTFADDDGRTVRVNVPRDESETYVFTFPDDANGKTVRVGGTLSVETESVEDQRHYAQDGGASAAELDAIVEPRQTLVLTADGAEIVREAASRDA